MKNFSNRARACSLTVILMTATALAMPLPVMAGNEATHVVVAPGNSFDQGKKLLPILHSHVLNEMNPGSKMLVVDGGDVAEIATLVRPEGEAGWIRKDRDLLRGIGTVKRHFEATGASANTSTILLPETLTFLGEQALAAYEGPVCVLIQGDALYKNPADAIASMLDPAAKISPVRIPFDGHVRGTRFDTPYGASDRADMLDGFSLHFAYSEDWQFNEDFEWIKRFWTLMVQEMGGELVTFTSDLEVAAKNFAACQTGVTAKVEFNQTKDKVQMVVLNEIPLAKASEEIKIPEVPEGKVQDSATQWGQPQKLAEPVNPAVVEKAGTVPSASGKVPVVTVTSEPEEEQLASVLEEVLREKQNNLIEETHADHVPVVPSTKRGTSRESYRVILSWSGEKCRNVDLDLYARVDDRSYISYQTPHGPLGTHVKVPSAGERNGIEVISLATGVNKEDVQLSVNHYRGGCDGPVTAWLTVMQDGAPDMTHSVPIAFDTTRGNGGGASSPSHWKHMSLADALSGAASSL